MTIYFINVFVIGEENGGWSDHYLIKTGSIPAGVIFLLLLIASCLIACLLRKFHNIKHQKYKIKLINTLKNNDDIKERIINLAYKNKREYIEGDIIIPTYLIDMMNKAYDNKYSNKELYKIYTDNFFND